jgi:hypothetical protein
MERHANTCRALVTFLLGGAVGMGAAFLMSKVCRMRGGEEGSKTEVGQPTPYCDVPEGADICFPK